MYEKDTMNIKNTPRLWTRKTFATHMSQKGLIYISRYKALITLRFYLNALSLLVFLNLHRGQLGSCWHEDCISAGFGPKTVHFQ